MSELKKSIDKNTDSVKNDPKLKYNLKKNPIGKGSFSTVYYATDESENEYALKRIPISKLENNNTNRFLRELEISKQMKHPNIVKSYEVIETEKSWYIVTEYCNNGTLSDIIKKFKNNDIPHNDKEIICKRYLTQLKNALKYLFKSKIVHRDLKPQNILISGTYPNDTLKLADFGFSRYFNTNDNANDNDDDHSEFLMTSFCGTPLYMAPELLINKKYNNQADLWSFGVIMYEMLYGTNPYNYPKKMSNLLELIETKEITFPNVYSKQCLDLLKSLLQTDVKNRIDWKKFFRHEWFDKQIPSGFSRESLSNSMENLQSLDTEEERSPNSISPPSKSSDNGQQFPLVKNTNIIVTNNKEPNNQFNVDDLDDDYEIIDCAELNPCDYELCKEQENSGATFFQILSNSVKYLIKRTSGEL
jgi:serine/threonine protein kinase